MDLAESNLSPRVAKNPILRPEQTNANRYSPFTILGPRASSPIAQSFKAPRSSRLATHQRSNRPGASQQDVLLCSTAVLRHTGGPAKADRLHTGHGECLYSTCGPPRVEELCLAVLVAHSQAVMLPSDKATSETASSASAGTPRARKAHHPHNCRAVEPGREKGCAAQLLP